MRHATIAPVIFAALLTASCQNATAPVQSPDSNESIAKLKSGKLVVRVVWDGQGVPDKRVEVLELHLTGTTDAAGYAKFDLRPGEACFFPADVMHKFKDGKLRSGSTHGPKVKTRAQAVAIMLSEKREARRGTHEYQSRAVQGLKDVKP